MSNKKSPDLNSTPLDRNDRPTADMLNRRHFIRNAATAAGALALPATAGARQDAAQSRLPESETSTTAWEELERRLGDTLSDLSEDEFLVIEQKGTNRFVQFIAQGRHGMRAEAVANAFLSPTAHLSNPRISRLLSIGWHAPTYELVKGMTEPPDGSPNFYVDAVSPVPFDRLAAMAVTTLRDVYGVRHPGDLYYYATSSEDEINIRFPSLRLKHQSAG